MLLSLVQCPACGSHFNGKSGRCVKKAIKLYTLTTLLVLVALMALLMYQVAGPNKKTESSHSLHGASARAAGFVPALSA